MYGISLFKLFYAFYGMIITGVQCADFKNAGIQHGIVRDVVEGGIGALELGMDFVQLRNVLIVNGNLLPLFFFGFAHEKRLLVLFSVLYSIHPVLNRIL